MVEIEVIEHGHFVSLAQEGGTEDRTEIAGAAGDENAHNGKKISEAECGESEGRIQGKFLTLGRGFFRVRAPDSRFPEPFQCRANAFR